MKKEGRLKIVMFRWKDAYTAGGWHDRDDMKRLVEDVDLWMWTSGILLKKTKRETIVCTTYQPDNSIHRTEERFCAIHKIPNTWIKDYKVIGHVPRSSCKS